VRHAREVLAAIAEALTDDRRKTATASTKHVHGLRERRLNQRRSRAAKTPRSAATGSSG
jgi:hypothetical protein